MGDWTDADLFAEKGLRASSGETPTPTDPADWGIGSESTASELTSARSDLVGLLDAGGRTVAPTEAAVAQARYDCWVEQAEEGHQLDHIAACRTAYLAAMDALREAMQPTRTTYETVQEEIARDTVYFDWDKDDIRADQRRELDAFIAAMKKIEPVTLYIEGHAATSGTNTYNAELSRR